MKKYIFPAVLVLAVCAAGVWLVNHDQPSPAVSPNTIGKQNQTNQTPNTKTGFDSSRFSLTEPSSIWVVVNKQRPLEPKKYIPLDLVAVGGGQQLRKEPARQLAKLIADAKLAGLGVSPLSGYRSYNTQVNVYNNEVATYGAATADTQSARPGHSEHQTGLSIDIGGGGCGIEDCFGNTAEGKWVAANAFKYGFIVRYVPGKETITGYRAEPWHIRYVGEELATQMNNQAVLTLEEFFGLPPAPSY